MFNQQSTGTLRDAAAAAEPVYSQSANSVIKSSIDRLTQPLYCCNALDGRPASASTQTKPERRSDLIELCRPGDHLLEALQTPLAPGRRTREYPALSFPAELLASVDAEPVLRLEPRPVLQPRRSPGMTLQFLVRAGRRLGLVGCIVLVLTPASVVAALQYLHASSPPETPVDTSASPPAPPPPRIVVSSLPAAVVPLPLPPASRHVPRSTAHKHKSAKPRLGHRVASIAAGNACPITAADRNKLSQQHNQARLAEGLGL